MSKEESNYGGREREEEKIRHGSIFCCCRSLLRLRRQNIVAWERPILSSVSFPRGNFSAIRKLHPTNRDGVTRAAQCTLLKGERGDFLAEWKRGRHKLRAGMEQREKERERAILKREKRWSGNGSFGPTFAGLHCMEEQRSIFAC